MHGWSSMATTSYEALFQKIRINFLFNHPFLSVLALSIPTSFESTRLSAFETNGSFVKVDLDKMARYGEEEITYLYAHTLLHIVLKHPFRQKTRDPFIWNMACDVVINNILATFSNVGKMPNDELIDGDLIDKCVEEVYDILYEEQEENKSGGDAGESEEVKAAFDPSGDQPIHRYDSSKRDLAEVEDHKTEQGDQEKIDGIIIQALSIARKNATQYAGLSIEIDQLIKPEISLQDLLKEYLIQSLFEKTTTYERPNKKFIHQNLYLPGYKKKDEMIELFVALDSSSSVSMEEYQKFLGIISEVCAGFYEYKITVIPFDKNVKTDHILAFDSFSTINEGELFIPKSDGGTDFDAVLKYLKTTSIRGDNLLMVLSDGEFTITEALVSKTLFVISESKNIKKFESYGRVIPFTL
jgi:predicted metal-dependent peptidase